VPTWRFTVGRKGISRVTVFERRDASTIYVEWWDDLGRHKAALKTVTGKPITDRALAEKIAVRMSQAQEQKRNQEASEMLGIPVGRTLGELFEELHENRSGKWSAGHAGKQKWARGFWLARLGANARLTTVRANVVERIVREAGAERVKAGKRPWTASTEIVLLRYMVESFHYAERKLKWIEARHNLSAVDIPRPRARSEAYTLEEARRLLPALEAIDWRAGFVGYVALQTGRRLTAVRTLPSRARWATVHDGYAVLHFPAETDKVGNVGEAVVTGRALELVQRALTEGWKVPSYHVCYRWLKKAHKAAKITPRPELGWHSLKRLMATMAHGHPGREKQSGTTREMLDRVYVQDVVEPKVDLAKALAAQLDGT
jgi:hypothetical protein